MSRNRPLGWVAPPRAWPEERLLANETVQRLRDAIAELPHVPVDHFGPVEEGV